MASPDNKCSVWGEFRAGEIVICGDHRCVVIEFDPDDVMPRHVPLKLQVPEIGKESACFCAHKSKIKKATSDSGLY